uniref:Uncharacterized protein n=1 Tax=Rhizophora mucronata TaxID=61149 RepID=A0A2P2KWN7_RHIMU
MLLYIPDPSIHQLVSWLQEATLWLNLQSSRMPHFHQGRTCL